MILGDVHCLMHSGSEPSEKQTSRMANEAGDLGL